MRTYEQATSYREEVPAVEIYPDRVVQYTEQQRLSRQCKRTRRECERRAKERSAEQSAEDLAREAHLSRILAGGQA